MFARPQMEALLETVSIVTLSGDLWRVPLVEEEPSEIMWMPPLKLLLHEFAFLDSFHSIAYFLHSLLLVSVEMVVYFLTPCI